MERLRLGLIGLGAILGIVFVSSSGMRSGAAPSRSAPGETLSVLGVAPKMDAKAAPAKKPAKLEAAKPEPKR
jgi:hypothetical protein